jgi:hypothetical protein
MHSAILWVRPPDESERQKWPAFLATISRLEGNVALARLAENVWLVNFQDSPFAFARLVVAFEQHKLPYGILPLEHEPQWLPAAFDPKTI